MKLQSQRVWLDWYAEIKHERTLAWSILTVGVLGVCWHFFSFAEINLPYLTLTTIGLYLIVRVSGLIQEGETAQLLREEHRQKTVSRYEMDRKPIALGWLVFALLTSVAVTYSSFVVGLYRLDLLFFFAFVALMAIFMRTLASRKTDWFLISVVFELLILLTAYFILQPVDQYLLERNLVIAGLSVFAEMGLILISLTKQTHTNRSYLKIAVFGHCLAYLGTWVILSTLEPALRWQVGLISLAMLLAMSGLIGWAWAKRLSFAKLLIGASLIVLLLFSYLFLSSLSIALLWLGIAGLCGLFGVLTPSRSLRNFGLISFGIGSVTYWLNSVETALELGRFWQHPIFWTGCLIIVMAWLADWALHFVKMTGLEAQLRPLQHRILILLAGCTALTLVLAFGTGIWLILGLSLVSFTIGQLALYRQDLSLLWISGLGLLYVLVNLISLNALLNDGQRLLIFGWLAILILLTVITLRQYEQHQ